MVNNEGMDWGLLFLDSSNIGWSSFKIWVDVFIAKSVVPAPRVG